jgi:uncharacterized SAM-binding protein YcdF (DUF218 family)
MVEMSKLLWALAPSRVSPVTSAAGQYDAIVVLSNLMEQDGTLNDESRERMNLAVREFSSGYASVIVTCGWAYRTDTPVAIAEAMREYAVIVGVAASAVIAESKSRDTVGHAIFTKNTLAIPNRWRKLLVVTSDYHVGRAREIFNFVYGVKYAIEVRGAPARYAEAIAEREHQATQEFRNTFADVKPGDDDAIFQRLRERHPFYNGLVYPKV